MLLVPHKVTVCELLTIPSIDQQLIELKEFMEKHGVYKETT